MDVSTGEIVATVGSLFGAGVVWGGFVLKVKAIQEKIETIRRDQGQRIGAMEDQIAELRGFIMGARHRKKTKPAGVPTE